MMQTVPPLFIFHLRRPDRPALILSPFGKALPISTIDRPIMGLFGSDPELDAVNQFRELLYKQVDGEIRSWLTEMRFIPRFLVSAVLFLLVYFILSLAIRDPIPIVVQAAGASVAAVAMFLWLGRRDQLSSRAVEKRAKVRAVVDGITFSYDPVLEAWEDLVLQYFTQPQLILADLLAEIRRSAGSESAELSQALLEALRTRYGDRTMQKLQKRFADPSVPFESLISWARAFKADPGLLALYLGLIP